VPPRESNTAPTDYEKKALVFIVLNQSLIFDVPQSVQVAFIQIGTYAAKIGIQSD
jgi:hypothetical protein